MQPIRCVGLEWELPLIGKGTIVRISPRDFASRFFAIEANGQPFSPKDERSILTQAYTTCLDICLENGTAGHMSRQTILEKWRADPFWGKAGRSSGPSTSSATSQLSWDESNRKPDPPNGPANFDFRKVPDRPRRFADTYTPRDHAMPNYVIPPRDFSPLKDLTVSAFYHRFCASNPDAREQIPWDVILTAYRDYVCKYYGNDLDHVWQAFKATSLDIPHGIRWKHCMLLEDEMKRLKPTSRSLRKHSRQSFDESVSDPIPRRVKVKLTSESSDILGVSGTVDPGHRKPLSPLFVPKTSITTSPPRLYSPSTPHLKVEWMPEQLGTDEARPIVLPLDIAVKGIASKSQAIHESPGSISRRSTESSGHVPQVSSKMVRQTVSRSNAGHYPMPRSPTLSIEAAAAPMNLEDYRRKNSASSSAVGVEEAVEGSDLGHDLLQSLIHSGKERATTKHAALAANKQVACPANSISFISKYPSLGPTNSADTQCTTPPVPEMAATGNALPLAPEPVTACSISTVLSGTITPAETMSTQISTESTRSSLAAVQENSRSLQKSVTKHVVRLEAFLEGAATELEANEKAITPQNIRLEALLQCALSELRALRLVMEVQPAAPEQKMGSRKSVTSLFVRLEAFMDGAVTEQKPHDDNEVSPRSIRLEALLGSAVTELKVLKSALAA